MARPGLTKHPKFLRLVHMLAEPPAHVLGHLEFLWATAYECGNPVIGDATDVELAAGWDGEPGRLCTALLECGGALRAGFLEHADDADRECVTDVTEGVRYAIHDLFDHAPEYVQHRASREIERAKEKACVTCGKAFRSPEKHAKFCGNSCRQKEFRNRTKESVTEGCNEAVTHVTQRNAPPAPAPAPAPINNKKSARTSRASFVQPSLADVVAYCRERKNHVDPEAFLNHYESNGWLVGKNPMKDWHAAVRTWERNGRSVTPAAPTRLKEL